MLTINLKPLTTMSSLTIPKTPVPSAPPTPTHGRRVCFGTIPTNTGHRVAIYGPGGIGKTTIVAQAPGPVAFIDLDESLPRLRANLEAVNTLKNICPVSGISSWQELRFMLQADGWDGIKSIAIDTATRAEELCLKHMLETVVNEKGSRVSSIEGYGYGKGYQHLFDTFLPLLGDLDAHTRAGRHVFLILHEITATVPNPEGEDWLRYEPRLQGQPKNSIRHRVREWADHLLFLGYDVDVGKDGVGRGSGTRTIYATERPHCMAKSRTSANVFPLGQFTWSTLIK
jgi:hypothetical protein